MNREKVKFWHSLAGRLGLLFTALVICSILGAGYLVFQQASSVIVSYSEEQVVHNSELAELNFYNLLNEVGNDIAVFSQNPILRQYINDPSSNNQSQVGELFSVILKNKPQYFQIRILDIDNNGKELIRFDKKNGNIIPTQKDKLQFKGERNYFINAMAAREKSYFFSEINLNEEFGVVSLPHTPTLRAVGYLYNQSSQIDALLVINVDLSLLYQELNQIASQNSKVFLVNENGEYIFAPSMQKTFSKQLNSDESFIKDFGQTPKNLLLDNETIDFLKDADDNNFIYHIKTFSYTPDSPLYLVTLIEFDAIMETAKIVRNSSLVSVAGICIIALLLVFIITRFLSKNINQITDAVTQFDHEQPQFEHGPVLPESQKDEIGLLARSFAKMRNRIDQQVAQLKDALNNEQKAIKERDEFLQNMSHELRTPLNSIIGLTYLLNKNKPSKQQQPIIDALKKSTTNLKGLMHDILDQQKLMEGEIKLNYSPQNYHQLLSDIYQNYQYEAVNKGLIFSLNTDDRLQKNRYATDALRFSQIVTNLVVNALKYTHNGEVNMIAEISDDNDRLIIHIVDTGIGIEASNIEKLNKRFYQAASSAISKDDSYGLGLSIVKQLTDLFEGKLIVESKVDSGSKFTVELPLINVGAASSDNIAPNAVADFGILKQQYHIIHIEDDDASQLLIKNMLNDFPVSLVQVKTIQEADKQVDVKAPNVIISDLMLDGEITENAIMKYRDELKIPVILTSGFEDDKMAAISDLYLQKPFEIENLLDLLIVELGKNEYDFPMLKKTYEQYDNQADKIINFLDILIKEFETYIRRIEENIESQDDAEWKAINHKLVTHIKALELGGLKKMLPENISALNNDTCAMICNQLSYCLACFRVDRRINSIN